MGNTLTAEQLQEGRRLYDALVRTCGWEDGESDALCKWMLGHGSALLDMASWCLDYEAGTLVAERKAATARAEQAEAERDEARGQARDMSNASSECESLRERAEKAEEGHTNALAEVVEAGLREDAAIDRAEKAEAALRRIEDAWPLTVESVSGTGDEVRLYTGPYDGLVELQDAIDAAREVLDG